MLTSFSGPPVFLASQPKKKLKKKSKTKVAKPEKLDEIDSALRDLGATPHLQTRDGQSSLTSKDFLPPSNLFAVDPKMLDADQELRRIFGSKVVSSGLTSTPPSALAYFGSRISNNPHHRINRKSRATILSQPLANWPPYNKSSHLSMIILDQAQGEGSGLATGRNRWFRFDHNNSYRAIQSRFISAVMSSNPNRLTPILHTHPYHPDTLLQLSDVMNEQEDPGQSLDFLNRALFSYEKSLHYSFNLSKGEGCLDYRQIENRGFFRALEKKLQVSMKRGCWRTAFETCKLLLGLNPYQDPFGALLWMDLLAPRVKQYQYFVDLVQSLPAIQSSDPEGGIYIEAYPGLFYSKALCLRALHGTQDSLDGPSNIALESAILRFPQVLLPLGQSLNIDLPSTLLKCKRAQPQTTYQPTSDNVLHLLSQTYVCRAADLWKEQSTCRWLQETIKRCYCLLEPRNDPDVLLSHEFASVSPSPAKLEGVYRSVYVSDVQALKRLLPPQPAQEVMYSFDPWPPSDGTYYDRSYFTNHLPGDSLTPQRAQRLLEEDLEDAGPVLMRPNRPAGILQRLLDDASGEAVDRRRAHELIERYQVVLQADDDMLEPAERRAVLERLDELIVLVQAPPDQQEPLDDHEREAVPLGSPGSRARMPGSFWDADDAGDSSSE